MRVAFVLLIAGVAIVISGCSGGSGDGHSGRGAYFDAIESELDCGTATPESTPNPTESVAEAQRAIGTFAALTPPPELASAHREVADAAQAMLDFGTIDTTIPSVVANALEKRSAYATAVAKWEEAFASHYGARLFKNEGASMEPALHNGDIVAFMPYAGQDLSRWQIIVFKLPLDESRWFVKRVVATPGETVEIRDEKILINGAPVEGDTFALAGANYTYGPKTVPTDSYFVLGDNRRNSYDSHAWGNICGSDSCAFVSKDLILGQLPATGAKPLAKWWCPSPEPGTPKP